MFLENYTFKYPWRKYQANVLAELDAHMNDDKLNVVAAPGSGKTILGLEVVRRLNKNVLILSPTRTIKNQWLERFLTLFVQADQMPDFISTDIYNLKQFNVATYQGLHFAHRRKKIEEELECMEEEEATVPRGSTIDYDLIAEIKSNHIEVIVLDEAHHLRSAWWKSLTEVLKALSGVKLISLTATPPYDVDKSEWDKYVDLCGPVDCEISIPELVASKDLCPHQDFVIFNKLSREEEKIALEMKSDFANFAERLQLNQQFIQILAEMPELNHYAKHEEKIMGNPRYYSSLLVFLHAVGEKVDRTILRKLGGNSAIPQFDMEWLEIMLQGVLFEDQELFAQHRATLDAVRSELSQIGGIEKRNVTILNCSALKTLMASSACKMESILEIAEREYASLQSDLSMVVLTDYIRKEALGQAQYNKIGVVPIFQKLIQMEACPNIAILTGSLKIIPISLTPFLKEKVPGCEFLEIPVGGYVSIKISEKYKNQLVHAITQAVIEKKVNILIGTVALLGEGWDCPAVNSLIMASFVGSFMLSNQMRGRAIRHCKRDVQKVANIWHLVSVTKHDNERKLFSEWDLCDYGTLKRRFQGFVGIAYSEDVIQSGLERLEMVPEQALAREHESTNQKMYRLAENRAETKQRWEEILEKFGGEDIKIINTFQGNIAEEERFKSFAFRDLQGMIFGILAKIVLSFWMTMEGIGEIEILFAGLLALWQLYFVARLIGHYNPIKNMQAVGDTMLAALYDLGMFQTSRALVSNRVEKTKMVRDSFMQATLYSTRLHGATVYENNLYIQCIHELYQRVDNPRYVLMSIAHFRPSYFAVPTLFANNKANAELFHKHWKKHVGESKLVYTRHERGRKILLDARKGSFDYNNKFFERKRAVKADNWK